MLAPTDEEEPLTVCSNSFNLDPVSNMEIYLLGELEPNNPTPIGSVDMYFFKRILLSFDENLLEAITKYFICIPYGALSSWEP